MPFRAAHTCISIIFILQVDKFLSLKEARWVIFILNRIFLVRFGGISSEFGVAMAGILTILSRRTYPNSPSDRTWCHRANFRRSLEFGEGARNTGW